MVSNVLNFLDVSLMMFFEGLLIEKSERDYFYEENLEVLISCIIVSDEGIRRLVMGVVRWLFGDEKFMMIVRVSKGISLMGFKMNFWRLM